MSQSLHPDDLPLIRKFFGADLTDLDAADFRERLKAARKKYHPDNFTHLGDETVLEMAKDRFQQIEALAARVSAHFEAQDARDAALAETGPRIVYASDGLKIDIMTRDKALKYQLFGTALIFRGDQRSLPGTGARLIALEDYSPRVTSGFRDNVKVHLAFGPDTPLEDVVAWLYAHISGRTSTFVIEGKVVPVAPGPILAAIRQESRRELGPGDA